MTGTEGRLPRRGDSDGWHAQSLRWAWLWRVDTSTTPFAEPQGVPPDRDAQKTSETSNVSPDSCDGSPPLLTPLIEQFSLVKLSAVGRNQFPITSGNTTNRDPDDKEKYYRFDQLNWVNSDFTNNGKLKPDAPPMQLYDLAADLAQTKNVYRDHPDIVARLQKLFDDSAKSGRSRP